MDGTTTAGGPGADLAGRVLGERYELLTPIGVGGMAVVWRGRDHVLARMVAVKIVVTGPGDRRIQQEAQAAAALSHPHIAHVHDYGEFDADGQVFAYVVMELVEGGTLSERLASGPVTPRTAMRVCAEIAAALAAAHAAGLVHRDIKPANVMLGPTGAKVVDFGIAAATAPGGARDLDPEVLGTPAYLAPERLIDDAVEPASDVYALGVVLYRLLSGHSPWTVEDTTQMLTNHIYVEPAPLPPVAGVPGHIADLCARCLRKDPSRRPSAREVDALLSEAGATPQDAAPVIADQPRRRRRTVVAAALTAAAAVATGGWLLLPDDPDAAPEQAASAPAVGAPSTSSARPPTGAARATAPVEPAGTARLSRPAVATTTVSRSAAPSTATATATPTVTTPVPTPAPGGPVVAPTPTGPPATQAPPPATREFSSTAGTVTATCTSPSAAEIVSYSARKPFKVESAATTAVTFKHGKDVTTMTVTCVAGEPSTQVT